MKARRRLTVSQRMLQSAREAAKIARGELPPARVSRHVTAARAEVDPPPSYSAKRIKDIRGHMELSQPVFAAALNVSPDTVRAWEQGKREPEGPTLRLLEIAEHHADVFLKRVHVRIEEHEFLVPRDRSPGRKVSI